MKPFEVVSGDGPIILGQPHGGTFIPDALLSRLNHRGQLLSDTDWHISQLYDGLLPSVTVVRANFHRYIIDANRDPAGISLYPGRNTTELCPSTDFDGQPIWREGELADAAEVAERCVTYHAPYHAALAGEIERVKSRYGVAIIYDCHSIRSKIPFLFPGLLPVFSIGTNDGETCAQTVSDAVSERCFADPDRETVLNGRFKGGWTTRHYGQPRSGSHAIQMEIAQRAYLSEEKAPWQLDPIKATPLRQVLADCLMRLDNLARSGRLINL